MDHEKQPGPAHHLPGDPDGELAQNPAVDEFFSRLKSDMRRPKPGQEAISAALQAIQRLALEVDSEESAKAVTGPDATSGTRTCVICGAPNREQNRFCATCGVLLLEAPAELESAVSQSKPAPVPHAAAQEPALPAGQHHYHHHYHHHYFSTTDGVSQPTGPEMRAAADSSTARDAKPRTPLPGASLSRAESALRKMTQDWALACNTKQLDDLVDLYAADALVLRSNVPPVRGTAAIREFFFGTLDAGLGEVEMEPLRVELLGDFAFEAGRCKMLVPGAMGKRREERGKYLIIFTRQNGEWKAIADCWSSDLSLGVVAEPVSRPNLQATGTSVPRPPRKS
jgi:ketosteroid isomerase-like protein